MWKCQAWGALPFRTRLTSEMVLPQACVPSSGLRPFRYTQTRLAPGRPCRLLGLREARPAAGGGALLDRHPWAPESWACQEKPRNVMPSVVCVQNVMKGRNLMTGNYTEEHFRKDIALSCPPVFRKLPWFGRVAEGNNRHRSDNNKALMLAKHLTSIYNLK